MQTLNEKIKQIVRFSKTDLDASEIKQIKEAIEQDHAASMIPSTEYDAILHIGPWESQLKELRPLVGYIFNDSKNRFADGTIVRTSSLLGTHSPVDDLYLAHTRNTTYLVV